MRMSLSQVQVICQIWFRPLNRFTEFAEALMVVFFCPILVHILYDFHTNIFVLLE